MDSALDYIILGGIVLVVVFLLSPNIFDKTAGTVIDAAKDKWYNNGTIEDNESNNERIELPFLYDNLTFVLCTSNNICERLYGTTSYCNITDGYCYRYN